MGFFGERRGASSYSRDALVRRQAKALVGLAEAAIELPEKRRLAGAIAQQFVNRTIILEQFPRKRISAFELSQLALLKSELNYPVRPQADVVEEAKKVTNDA